MRLGHQARRVESGQARVIPRKRFSCANHLFNDRDMDSDGRLMWKEFMPRRGMTWRSSSARHSEQMQKATMDLEPPFTSSMSDIGDQLFKPSRENEHLQKQHRKCLGE